MSEGNRQNIKVLQHYNILKDKILGKGTFGHVFLGQDTKNNIPVAIKVIPLDKFKKQPEKIIPSLKNEIKNMQMLNHKNVVQLYNVVKTENNLYIIVEYCNQGNLERLIRQKNLSEEKCINIMCQIIEGFKCLNSNNIVHRDLKPENILLHDRTVKIADFGFSKVVESGMDEPILQSFVGTPLYMSPQILQKQNYSSKTDIWSLGMIFYELLYSRRAWDGKGYFDLLDNILKKSLQFPSLPKVHQQTKNIISRMLQLKEEDRINWEELFQFFQIENLRLIYSDLLGNSNQQQKDFQNLQLHQLYDQNCNSRIPHHPSSPTSTVSIKSERIDEEDKFNQAVAETNLNRIDEENLSDSSGNGLHQAPNIQNQRSSDSNDDDLMNESQMNNLLEYFTSNINMAQQFQLVLQLQSLLNKKRGQKLSINEVKQMIMNQINPQNQNSSSQINQQQNTQMRGGLFAQTNPMFQNIQLNKQTKSQNYSNQQEYNENNNNSCPQNNNGHEKHNINFNINNNNNENQNDNNKNNIYTNGIDINHNQHTTNGFNKNKTSSYIDEID